MSKSPTSGFATPQEPARTQHDLPTQAFVDYSSESILLSLLDRVPEAILCLDHEFRITFANSAARRVSRLTSADLNNRTHWEIFPESAGTDLERVYRQAMIDREPAHIEYFHAPFDVWVDVDIYPTDQGIALYYRDITTRKRAENARDAATRQLQQVFESTPESIVCIDRNWNCNFANRAARI